VEGTDLEDKPEFSGAERSKVEHSRAQQSGYD